MTIHWKAVGQCLTVMLFLLKVTQFVILENLSILDLALPGVKGFKNKNYIAGLKEFDSGSKGSKVN